MDKREELYNNLIATGKVSENEIGTLEDFKSAIFDDETASKFHNNLLSVFSEDEIGSSSDFVSSISSDFGKKKVETEVGSEVSQSLETPTISDEDKYLSDLTPEQRASAEKHGYTQEIINQRKKKEKYVISEEDKAFSNAMIASLDEKKKEIDAKLSSEYASVRGEVPNIFRGVSYGGTATGSPVDISTPELTKLRSESKYINRAKDYLEVVAKGDEETAIKRFWRGLKTTDVTNALTAGLSQMADDAQILALTNKLEAEGVDGLSEEEKGILLLKNISDYSQQLASKDRSFAVGSGIAESIPFMTAMILTGGAGEATSTAIQGTSKAIYRKLLANVGEAGVRALMMPSTYGGTMERMTSDTDMDLQIAEEGEKLPEAFLKSLGANTVETFAEAAVGKGIENFLSKANKSGIKLFKGSKFGEIMDAASAGVKGSKALQAMSIQDPISEFGEEVFSGVVTPLITGDGTPADFFEAENMIRTALITGVMSTSMRALSQVAGIRDYKMTQKGMSGYNSLTDEQKQLFNEAVDTDDVDTSTKKIVDLISASDNVEDAKKQPSLISYARSIIRAKKQATDALGKDKTPTYQIGNKVFTEKANFEKEYNKQKNEGNLQPIKINNDEVTATQIDNDLRGGIVDNPTIEENKKEMQKDTEAKGSESVGEETKEKASGEEVLTDEVIYSLDSVDEGKPMDKNVINSSINKLYDALDKADNESDKAFIEEQINKLESYENITEVKAVETPERTTVTSVRVNREKPKSKKHRERTVNQELSNEGADNYTFVLEQDEDGLFVQSFDETGKRSDTKRLNAQTTEDLGIGEISFDGDGNVSGIELIDKSGESIKINNPEIAIDYALEKKEADLGDVADPEFDRAITVVVQDMGTKYERVKVEQLKTKQNAEKTGTSIEETMQEKGNVEGEMQRLRVRDNEESGMEAEKPKEKVTRKQKYKKAQDNVRNIRKDYTKKLKEAKTDAEKLKLSKQYFRDIIRSYSPINASAKTALMRAFSSGTQIVEFNKLMMKKLESDVSKGTTIDKAIDNYISTVDRINKSALRNEIKSMKTSSSDKKTAKGLALTKKLINETSSAKTKIEKGEIGEGLTKQERVDAIVGEKLAEGKSKTQATIEAKAIVDYEIDKEVKEYADNYISTAIDDQVDKGNDYAPIAGDFASRFNGATIEELASLMDDIDTYRREGRSKASNRVVDNAIERAEGHKKIAEEIPEAISDFVGEMPTSESKTGMTPAKQIAKIFKNIKNEGIRKALSDLAVLSTTSGFGMKYLHTLRTMNKLLTDSDSGYVNKVLDMLQKNEVKIMQDVYETEDGVMSSLAKVFGIEEKRSEGKGENIANLGHHRKVKRAIRELMKQDVKLTLPLDGNAGALTNVSLGEAMYIYALTQNDAVVEHFLKNGQITQETINQLKDIMAKGVNLDVYEVYRKGFEDIGDKMESKLKKHDIPFERVENYAPLRTKKHDGAKLDQAHEGMETVPLTENHSSLQQRVDNTLEYNLLGVSLDVIFKGHLLESSKLINNVDIENAVNGVLNDANVKKVLRAFGLYDVYAGLIKGSMGYGHSGKFEGFGRKVSKIARATLGGKPMQTFKQVTSFAAGLDEYSKIEGEGSFVKDMPKIKNIFKWHDFMMENSPAYRMRIENWYRADIDGSVTDTEIDNKIKEVFETVGSLNMIPTKFGDGVGILMGYVPVYNKAIRAGMSPQQAIDLFEKYDETQQAQLKSNRTAIQEAGGITKLVTMWQSTAIAYMNKSNQAKIDIWKTYRKTGKLDKKALYRLLLYRQVLNGMFQAISGLPGLFLGDDEDKWKDFGAGMFRSQILGNMNAIPLFSETFGEVYNFLESKLLGKRYNYGGSSVMGTNIRHFLDAIRGVEKAYESGTGADKLSSLGGAAATGADLIWGAGLYNNYRMIDGIVNTADDLINSGGVTKQALGDIMVAPKSQIAKE